MEAVLLTTLKFCLTVPTPIEFGRWFARAVNMDQKTEVLQQVRLPP